MSTGSIFPNFPMLSCILPLNSFMNPLVTFTASPSLTRSMLSSHRTSVMAPVSSAINASTSLCSDWSYCDETTRGSGFSTTFATRLMLLERGVRFPILINSPNSFLHSFCINSPVDYYISLHPYRCKAAVEKLGTFVVR